MLFGKKKRDKKTEAEKKEKEKILLEKAAIEEEIKRLKEEKKRLEEEKEEEPFVVPEMDADELENHAIMLRIKGKTKEAFACNYKAAEMGSCCSQYFCGEKFGENGDFEKAAFWFEKAAENGHLSAIYDLSKLILSGKAKMNGRFFALLKEKAKYDDPGSCYYFGMMHYYGKGTEKDFPKAYYFIEKSSLLEYSGADTSLLEEAKNQYVFENGADSIYGFYRKVSEMFASETGRAFYKEKADEYREKAFKPIEITVTFEPGQEIYIDGTFASDEGRFEEAFELYRKAAGLGYSPAMASCAFCYIDGKGVLQNMEAAKLFALAGAKSGDLTCKLILKNYFNETV